MIITKEEKEILLTILDNHIARLKLSYDCDRLKTIKKEIKEAKHIYNKLNKKYKVIR